MGSVERVLFIATLLLALVIFLANLGLRRSSRRV
jgi:hypothetical protein